MKKLTLVEQKLLDFIGKHGSVTLEEIKSWSALDFVKGYAVNEFCRELVREGLIKKAIAGDGVTFYSAVK